MKFRLAIGYLLFIVGLVWGMGIGRYQIFPYNLVKPYYDEIKGFLIDTQEVSQPQSLAEKILDARQERKTFFPFDRFAIRDEQFSDDGYLLISRYSLDHGQVIIELVRALNFEVLYQWIPPIKEILSRGKIDNHTNSLGGYRAQHPLLLPNGSVVFHSGEGPLVKLDSCSNIEWTIAKHFHHSIELSHEHNLIVPINNTPPLQRFPDPLEDHGFAVVSLDGRIKKVFSIATILLENEYRGLFLGVGSFEEDRIHLNDAQPIHQNRGSAMVGDIALSMRTLSTVMLYRPTTNKIIWLKTGPWLNQHDVNMLPDGSFSVFGNDVIFGESLQYPDRFSQVYIYYPEKDSIQTPYTEGIRKAKMRSDTGGRARVLNNGDVFIEEFDRARLLRLAPHSRRWEYVNRISATTSGFVHWSRYLYDHEVSSFYKEATCQ